MLGGYYFSIRNKINDNANAAIVPFAQSEIVTTFISGIDPSLKETFLNLFNQVIIKLESNKSGEILDEFNHILD